MTQHPYPAILIQAPPPLLEHDFSDVLVNLDEKGVSHVFEQRPPTAYAALEWLIPTGIVLFITHSYFDGIFKELGKDHYHWFKTAFSSLYKKAFGDHATAKFGILSTGKVKAPLHFSGTLSFIYVNDLGYRVKLLFPLDVSADDYALSCEEFMKLIAAHEAQHADDPLGKEIEFQAQTKAALTSGAIPIENTRPTITLLVFWSRHDRCFHVADPIASSRTGKLVAKQIGRE